MAEWAGCVEEDVRLVRGSTVDFPMVEAVPAIPVARRVQLRPLPAMPIQPAQSGRSLPRTHPAAVASAVFGFTALVPIVCQVAGIIFGIVAIVRINRDRRNGVPTTGTGLAIAGMTVSALALVGWIMLAVVMAGVSTAFSQIDSGLGGILP